ncbi:MAG: choice-of-anchor D domain-containing protein [Acidobacteria bacterium]|nr:choice-of-anchor D domain-containing protein [Acidobacteriota bacterium]
MKIMRWLLVFASAVVLAVILMGSILPNNPIAPKVAAQTGTAKIYFVDIGQGAGTLIVSPTGKTLLVDGGPNGGGTSKLVPLLNTLGINTIDFTVVTHYHIDHIVGITELLNANRVSGIAYDNGDGVNVVPPNPGGTLTAFNNYKSATNRPGVTRQQITPGTVIDLGGGMRATCVAAGGNLQSGGSVLINTADINGQSIALLIEYNNFDYLVAGDLTGAGSTSTARGPDVESFVGQQAGDVDVIQLSHHGSTTSSNQRLLTAAKAEVAFAQIGETNTFGHPNREVVNRYLNTPTTNGTAFNGTGVPTPGTSPIFYQTQASPPTDTRTTVQGISGAAFGNGGQGTIMLETNGMTNYTIKSFDDNGVKISPAQHVYNIDTASNGVTTNFPPTVIPSVNPTLPLANEVGVVTAFVNDKESPISSVVLNFSLNGAAQTPINMTLVSGNMYQGSVPAQANGTRVDYTVVATAGGQTSSYSDGYFSGTTPITNLKTLNANGEPLYLDYAARIQALVTAGTGIYSTSGANNDYAQDATAGINISRTTQPTTPAIQPTSTGQMVEVRGRIGMLDGVLRLEVTPRFAETTSPFGITSISTGNTVTPVSMTLAQINANPEATEGRLVSVANVTITSGTIPPSPASLDRFLTISDGTATFMLKVDKDTNVPGLATPTTAFTLVGTVQQDDPLRPFTATYSVTPRSRVDLGAPDPGATVLAIGDARVDMVDNTDGTPPTDFVPDLIGQQVKVRGVVTSIDFRGGAGVEYYIQDTTGGIDIFSTGTDFGPFNIGDSVEAFGVVTQFNGLTEIVPSGAQTNFTLLPPGTIPPVTPQVVTLSQLGNNGAGEALEGRLVRINNVTITSGTFPPTGSSGNVTISDGTGSITLRVDSDTNIDGTPTPTGTFSVIGLASQFDTSSPFDSGYQLLPRSTADITNGVGASAITLSPTPVNFGTVNVAMTVMAPVTITNTSASTVTLTIPFTITGADANQFTATAPDTTVLAGNSSTMAMVMFRPTTAGSKTATLNVSSTGGSATTTLTGIGQNVANQNTALVISEFRFRGPSGGNDEFVEIYNNTANTINIGGLQLRGSNNAGTTSVRATIAANVMLPARGHFLFTNNGAAGYSGAVPGNQTYATGITDDGGIALTMPTGGTNFMILDQVGLSNGSAFKEGTVLASLGTQNLNRSYERKPGGNQGSTTDTDNNANDFMITTPSDPQNLASAPTPNLTLSVTPATVNFGSVAVNASATMNITATNTGTGTVTLTPPFTFTGTDSAQFSAMAPASTTIGPNSSTTITLVFRPTSAGTKNASVTVTSNSGMGTVTVTGSGTIAGAGLNPKLYIADTANNRIQIFDPATGTFTAFGIAGVTPSSLNQPQGVTSNGNTGEMYVADTGNNAIKMFSSTGTFIKVIAGAGVAPGFVNAPEGVAFDNVQGILYVADTGNSRIVKFDATGNYLGLVAGAGVTPGTVNKPQGLALDNSGSLYIADTLNNRIQKFSSTGQFSMVFAGLGVTPGLVNQPKGVAVNPMSGDIIVADSGNNRIQRFSSTGTFLSIVAGAGTALNQVSRPEGVRINNSNGAIIVADTGNSRLLDITNQLLFGSAGRGSNNVNPGFFAGPTGMQ